LAYARLGNSELGADIAMGPVFEDHLLEDPARSLGKSRKRGLELVADRLRVLEGIDSGLEEFLDIAEIHRSDTPVARTPELFSHVVQRGPLARSIGEGKTGVARLEDSQPRSLRGVVVIDRRDSAGIAGPDCGSRRSFHRCVERVIGFHFDPRARYSL